MDGVRRASGTELDLKAALIALVDEANATKCLILRGRDRVLQHQDSMLQAWAELSRREDRDTHGDAGVGQAGSRGPAGAQPDTGASPPGASWRMRLDGLTTAWVDQVKAMQVEILRLLELVRDAGDLIAEIDAADLLPEASDRPEAGDSPDGCAMPLGDRSAVPSTARAGTAGAEGGENEGGENVVFVEAWQTQRRIVAILQKCQDLSAAIARRRGVLLLDLDGLETFAERVQAASATSPSHGGHA